MPFKGSNISEYIWKDYLTAQEAKLPRLADVEDVTSRVIRIMGGNPGEMQLQGTNTYLLGTGKSRILVDSGQGIPIWAENLIKILEERDLDISHVLLTHWHGDHTGGVPDLVSYNPLLASRIYKNQPDCGQLPIEDGQIFRVEGATVKAVFTPGHTTDHMSFVLEEENALFTGDNVLGHGYSVVEDLGIYMASLRYMGDQNCKIGYPAHGIKIMDLPLKIKQYIRQKEIRERQVFSALVKSKAKVSQAGNGGKGSLTTKELVYSLHGEVPDEMFELALEPFMTEVLWKLAGDRKVGFELAGGHRKWFLNERAGVAGTMCN